MKKISLLGATGSIGTQTLDVIKSHPDKFTLEAISIGRNIDLGLKQINEYKPKLVSVQFKEDYDKLLKEIPKNTKLFYGNEGLEEVAANNDADILVNAVLGSVGLKPTLSAIQAGKTIAIANKETLVTAGHLVTAEANKFNVNLLPVDSEHSAIFQCLQGERLQEVDKLILTASGGSFRHLERSQLANVTVQDALNHPNWSMGAKITIDSATMMNKGLEVIEAYWLFGMPYEKIEVLLHQESIIHSMVEFIDGSVIAQLGTPDMRVPIQYALTYPNRLDLVGKKRLSLWEVGKLHFSKPSFDRYRCLGFAFEAGKSGGTVPTVLNAANEEAVSLFLNGTISFLEIEEAIEKALNWHQKISSPTLEEIQHIDKEVRTFVKKVMVK
ncbi:1-deoxy-D-xylulose-5-phosphate reductoisomerase [Anaerobacillus isosaccharinicus]|uniref:1-deoxy-D-xylulose 5-phosphate reductoisomerase n=1 Tax=Anaerobacillus isosaccharinicus TaxID=1532552 RepID=A0A1S2L6G1_9BACI|nr:1-deoxy-D-xylulose-5-phosphate reductoisomerase [Anaerobacillus isosaccharinicus]MBA5587300.1 1-deoxy-D-xylulose-5-phosphate reductoisomerase [Anaerobacillus isosaccharinicus]QOY34507.1 1-deoxy-D-xylulose-5-phosphate reductoisomerase [Anaerobacillus isosaccharinicus]